MLTAAEIEEWNAVDQPDNVEPQWLSLHCDRLAERAVKAEMQRDELLRAVHRVLEQFGHTHKHLYAIEVCWAAIRKIEEQNNVATLPTDHPPG